MRNIRSRAGVARDHDEAVLLDLLDLLDLLEPVATVTIDDPMPHDARARDPGFQPFESFIHHTRRTSATASATDRMRTMTGGDSHADLCHMSFCGTDRSRSLLAQVWPVVRSAEPVGTATR